MRKMAIMLIAVVALMVIGCQPPEGMGGVTTEQFEALKTQVETLEANVEALHASLDSLTTLYNEHITKYHKGKGTAPKPPAPKPPPTKIK